MKIVALVMGQDCEDYIELALQSVQGANKIYFLDGGSTDKTIEIAEKYCDEVWHHKFEKDNKDAIPNQKNFFLANLIEKHNDGETYGIYLDADEVLDDMDKLKKWIERFGDAVTERHPCIHLKMHHFIGGLWMEDSTRPEHFVSSRLFKIQEGLHYPYHDHCVMQYKNQPLELRNLVRGVKIWHLGYIPQIWYFRKRYKEHLKRSTTHSRNFLNNWYKSHIFNQYPSKPLNPNEIPGLIYNFLDVDKDEIYFLKRNLEVKHFQMIKQWVDYFKFKNILDLGCGLGHYGYVAKNYFNLDYKGIELSSYAVNNIPYEGLDIEQGDISNIDLSKYNYDLVIGMDVLEHCEEKNIDKILTNIKQSGKKFLFSIPFEGENKDLYNDPTHKIFQDREWWYNKLKKNGFKILETPDYFLFNKQLVICE